MSFWTFYLMVGVVAAIAGEGKNVGCLGMIMLLVAWPVFVLGALATYGIEVVQATGQLIAFPDQFHQRPRMDLREARLRGRA